MVMQTIGQNILDNNMQIRANQEAIYYQLEDIETLDTAGSQMKVGNLHARAMRTQQTIDEDLAALVLYC